MRRLALKAMLFAAAALLVLAPVLAVGGSAFNNGRVLDAGIVAGLAASALLFAWLVLWVWSRSRRYPPR